MEETLDEYFAKQPKVRVKPMKPKVYCVVCGNKITNVYRRWKESDTVTVHYEFGCNNCGTIVAIIGDDEKAARKAWNTSLIGQLRKAWTKYLKDSMFWSGSFTDIVRRMFGGDQ